MFVCGLSEQGQHLWRHFGDTDLSKNCDIFPVRGKGDFRARTGPRKLVGPVQKVLIDLWFHN